MRAQALAGFLASALVIATSPGPTVFGQRAMMVARDAVGVPLYEVDVAWPSKLPNNWIMGVPSSVAIDRGDHVWVLTRPRTVPADQKGNAAPAVLEFDSAGNFVQGWGGPADSYDWPDNEHGIAVDHTDHVWIGGIGGWVGCAPPWDCTRASKPTPKPDRSDDMLLKFTRQGALVRQFGRRSQSGGNTDTTNFNFAADVDVYSKTNEVFVADGYGNRRVIVLDADSGAFKRMWGAFGNKPLDTPFPRPSGGPETDGPGPQQFGIVHGIKVSRDGLVYVTDRHNRRIQVFTVEGKYLAQAFVNRDSVDSLLRNMAGIGGLALSPDPEQRFIYASDFDNSQIIIFDRKTLAMVGAVGRRGNNPGEFNNVHHLAVDSKGNVYTAEVGATRRVQRFVVKGASGAPSSRR